MDDLTFIFITCCIFFDFACYWYAVCLVIHDIKEAHAYDRAHAKRN